MNSSFVQPRTIPQFAELIAAQQDGYSLARPFYCSPDVFELDVEAVFMRCWLLAGHVSRIPQSGEYFLYEIAGESIIVIRDKQDEVHALYNVCTHRGSRVCRDECGSAAALVCPYHAWTFNQDGSLRGARGMPDGFDRTLHGLRRCPVKISHGMIFVYLGEGEPPEFDDILADLDPFLAPHELGSAKLCRRMTWEIRANWKLVVENFAECYHCGPAHPEYCSVMSHALSGSTGSAGDIAEFAAESQAWETATAQQGHFIGSVPPTSHRPHTASRIPIGKGGLSQSRGGRQIAPLMGRYRHNDGGLTSTRIYPGAYVIAPCDYAIVNRFTPLAVDRTLQEILWLVNPAAVEGVDYDPAEIVWLWQVTTDQDLRIIEDNHSGVTSRAYRPGPYSKTEDGVNRFVRWYLAKLAAACA